MIFEIKKSYKIPALIFGIGTVFALGIETRIGIFESPVLFFGALIAMPLVVSMYSFFIAKIYSGSKIFGRSYFFLGLGFFCIFITEATYVYFGDLMNQKVPLIADVLLAVSYLLIYTHLIINIHYFAEKIYHYQRVLLVFIPMLIILGYVTIVNQNDVVYDDRFMYGLVFVVLSSITLGLSIVGFTVFKQTALGIAWFFILIGMMVGTMGDFQYHYFDALQYPWLENHTLIFWSASNMIMIYALYRHQKSI